MLLKRILAAICALIGTAAAVLGVTVSLRSLDAAPVLLSPPDEARSTVTELMDAVCAGDYDTASQKILGTPSLGLDREAADDVGVLIWNAYVDSLSYTLEGECYATDDGLAQNVTMTGLDITSVTVNLRERSQTLLQQRVAEAEDTSEVYDENNDYRDDFVMAVLYDAAQDALDEDAEETTFDLTLKLSYQDGQWWVAADNELLDAISGGILY